MFKKRNGFGLDSIIIFISIIVIIGILVLVSNVFLKNLADVFVPLTTTMPKFDPTGNYANPVGDTTKSILGVYNMLRSGIIWALAALLMVSGILFMLEQIEVVPASTTYGILSKGILMPRMKEVLESKLGTSIIVPKDPVFSNAIGLYNLAAKTC